MKRNLLKLALCAMAALPLGAWADDVVAMRTTPNGELIYASEIGGGLTSYCTFTKVNGASFHDGNQGWYLPTGNTRAIQIDLTSPYTLSEGDQIIMTTVTASGSNVGVCISKESPTSAYGTWEASNYVLAPFPTHTSGDVVEATYTVTSSDILHGESTFYIFGSDKNCYVREVRVKRTESDNLMPSPATDRKTWNSSTYRTAISNKTTTKSGVLDDMVVGIGISVSNDYGIKLAGSSSAVYTPLQSAQNCIMVMAPAGVGRLYITSKPNTDGNKFSYKIGSSEALTTATMNKIDETYYSTTINLNLKVPTPIYLTSGNIVFIKSITYNSSIDTTVGSLGYSTFSCGSNIDFSGNTGLDIYKVSSVGTNVVLSSIDSKIVPANTGVILRGAAGTYTGTVVSEADAIDGNLLHATTAATSFDAHNYMWILTANSANDGVEFNKMTSGTLAAGKAYLVINDSGVAGSRSVVFEDSETTGISDVKVIRDEETIIYNLNGVRVQNPVKGIYIKNGKKFIVK